MFTSSWNYAQHIKSCGSNRRRPSTTTNSSKGIEEESPGKANSPANSPVKSDVPKSPATSGGESKSPVESTCKAKEIQSESSQNEDWKSSDEEEVIIKPRFITEKKQAKQLSSPSNKKKSSSGGCDEKEQRSKSPSGGGGGKEKKRNDATGTAKDSPPGSPPKLTEDELKRIRQIVNEDEMRCLKCHKQYCTISYLHRHAVRHLGWRRFKCKLCKFTAYNRSECTTHLRKVHTTKTLGIRDMNPFIHDLEPEKMKQEPSVLTRVERPSLERSNSNHSSSSENYNISTRRNTRVFDTKPYVRSGEEEEDGKPDSLTTLRTRKGAYNKPDLLKRKRMNSDEETDDEPLISKRKRTDSEVVADTNSITSSEEIGIEVKQSVKRGGRAVSNEPEPVFSGE